MSTSLSSVTLLESAPMVIPCRYGGRQRAPVYNKPTHISAIDKASTKLRIPLTAVQPTQALDDDGLVPGLCRLYLAGRCRQGARCYQVHADRAVVEQLRIEAAQQPTCCIEHGARCSLRGFPLGLTITIVPDRSPLNSAADGASEGWESAGPTDDGSSQSCEEAASAQRGVTLSIHACVPTCGLWKMYREDASANLVVPASKVCRVHREGLCRFGDECSFLHVCRNTPLGIATQRPALSVPRGFRNRSVHPAKASPFCGGGRRPQNSPALSANETSSCSLSPSASSSRQMSQLSADTMALSTEHEPPASSERSLMVSPGTAAERFRPIRLTHRPYTLSPSME